MRICYCGKNISHRKSDAIYCSKFCKNKSTLVAYRERHGLTVKPLTRKKIDCKTCGKIFARNINEQLFCSIKCKSAFHESQTKIIVCQDCGDTFVGKKRRRFYCDICVKTRQSERVVNNPDLCVGIVTQYKDIMFRSQLEARIAQKLDELKIIWTYEPCSFFFVDEGTGYIPDFYLKSYGIYLECKGSYWLSEKTYLKKSLVEKYTGKKVLIITEEQEKNLQKLLESSAF